MIFSDKILPHSRYTNVVVGIDKSYNSIFPNPILSESGDIFGSDWSTDGTTFVVGATTYLRDTSGNGNHVPKVSGTGLDTIYDFTAVNTYIGGNKLNKNAYVGNSYSLPANYDYPYTATGIYYDSSNPTHWKLQDFHYRKFNIQSLLVDNTVFAKLTYTASVLQSVDEVYIFNAAKTSDDLTALLAYIGITVEQEEQIITNSNPANTDYVTCVNANLSYVASYEGRAGLLRAVATATSAQFRFEKSKELAIGDVVRVEIGYFHPSANTTADGIIIKDLSNSQTYYTNESGKGSWVDYTSSTYTVLAIPVNTAPYIYLDNTTTGTTVGDNLYIDYYRMYVQRLNYYTNEL